MSYEYFEMKKENLPSTPKYKCNRCQAEEYHLAIINDKKDSMLLCEECLRFYHCISQNEKNEQ